MEDYWIGNLDVLEAESIHVLREVVAEFERPVLLYSAGKESSVLLRLAAKAFAPGPIPFPLLHVDTGYKFPEMYAFRDRVCRELGVELVVERNEEAIVAGTNPHDLGTRRCCELLKTSALLAGLRRGRHDAAIGGARRDEEMSRAKERIYSFRDGRGQWDPRSQRPELFGLYNGRLRDGESMRVFPLSNWTELDVWSYIEREAVPVAPLYFAAERLVEVRGDLLLPVGDAAPGGEREVQPVMCRFRTLGCMPCSGAIRSTARTVPEILAEMAASRHSERRHRLIDHDGEGAMEQKKKEGYF